MKTTSSVLFLTFIAFWLFFACSNGQGQPSDDRVISDMNVNQDGLIEAYCAKGKTGEQYWHPDDQTWYWDRGVVVKREANISGAPDAVVIVRGIARYHVNDDGYAFYKFLTTDNRYEGIPSPSKEKLTAYVKGELNKVFIGRAHNVVEVNRVELLDGAWVWHNAGSFTAEFSVKYREIVSYTDVVDRKSQFSIRFYRDEVDGPIKNLLASEEARDELKRTTYAEDQIEQMKSIQDR